MTKEKEVKKLGIRLLSDKILLDLNRKETKTESGLILSNNDSVKSGLVVVVGKGKRNEQGEYMPIDINIGDEVTFQYGTEIKIDGKSYTVVAEADVLTVKNQE